MSRSNVLCLNCDIFGVLAKYVMYRHFYTSLFRFTYPKFIITLVLIAALRNLEKLYTFIIFIVCILILIHIVFILYFVYIYIIYLLYLVDRTLLLSLFCYVQCICSCMHLPCKLSCINKI